MEYEGEGRIFCPFEYKADTPAGRIGGLGSTYGNLDRQADRVIAGAFDPWLAELKSGRAPSVKMTDSHREVVGVFDTVEGRKRGLYVEGAPLLSIAGGAEVYEKAKATPPLYDALSIGYRIRPGGSNWVEDSKIGERHLTDLDVAEVAVLAFPANPRALITSVKADDLEAIGSETDLEQLLRLAGFSGRQAKGIAAGGYAGLQDDGPEEFSTLLRAVQSASATLREGV